MTQQAYNAGFGVCRLSELQYCCKYYREHYWGSCQRYARVVAGGVARGTLRSIAGKIDRGIVRKTLLWRTKLQERHTSKMYQTQETHDTKEKTGEEEVYIQT